MHFGYSQTMSCFSIFKSQVLDIHSSFFGYPLISLIFEGIQKLNYGYPKTEERIYQNLSFGYSTLYIHNYFVITKCMFGYPKI